MSGIEIEGGIFFFLKKNPPPPPLKTKPPQDKARPTHPPRFLVYYTIPLKLKAGQKGVKNKKMKAPPKR